GIGKRVEVFRQCMNSCRKNAGNVLQTQAEKVLNLSARNQYGDAVGEANYHWPWNKFHRRTEASHAHDDEKRAGHHRTHEQAIDSVYRYNTRHDYDERAGRAANLRF